MAGEGLGWTRRGAPEGRRPGELVRVFGVERGRTQDQLPLTAELFKMHTLGICATSCLRFGEGEENWFGQVGVLVYKVYAQRAQRRVRVYKYTFAKRNASLRGSEVIMFYRNSMTVDARLPRTARGKAYFTVGRATWDDSYRTESS